MRDDTPREHLMGPLAEGEARCESRLSTLPMPTSSVDRDGLLYQAGWAAAEASALRARPFRRRTVACSLGSAVVAAGVTLLITLPMVSEPREAPPVVASENGAIDEPKREQEKEDPLLTPVPDVQAQNRSQPKWFVPATAANERPNLFAQRRRALRDVWSAPVVTSEWMQQGTASEPRQPVTARELLMQFVVDAS